MKTFEEARVRKSPGLFLWHSRTLARVTESAVEQDFATETKALFPHSLTCSSALKSHKLKFSLSQLLIVSISSISQFLIISTSHRLVSSFPLASQVKRYYHNDSLQVVPVGSSGFNFTHVRNSQKSKSPTRTYSTGQSVLH